MIKRKKVYISGPISGLAREEYLRRFMIAEVMLRVRGYDVCNPTRLAPCRWLWLYRLLGYYKTLLYDLWHMEHCDYILRLPGWSESTGAQIESYVATLTGIKEVPASDAIDICKAIWKSYEKCGYDR